MKSRITIEVNFEEGNRPVIQISQQPSDDVRDKLIKSFLESLHHESRWCRIMYMGNRSVYNPSVAEIDHVHVWHIIPISPRELQDEARLLNSHFDEWQKPQGPAPNAPRV